jgi:murein DD-endopeptidase MepM/ murein hydrolase activator NlpD
LPQTRAQIWGTLKRYLAYTAAGFIILGGVGAIESVQPPVVTSAKASETLRNSASAQALLLNSGNDQPSWIQRLRFDLTAPIAAAQRIIERSDATPYYPAPDTAWTTEAAASESQAAPQPAAPRLAAIAATPAPIAPKPAENPALLARGQVPATAANAAAAPESQAKASTRALVATLNWVYTGVDAPISNDDAAPDAAAPESADLPSPLADASLAESQDSASQQLLAAADTYAPNAAAADSQATATLTVASATATNQAAGQTANVPLDSAFEPVDSPDALEGEQRVIEVHRGDTLFGLLTKAGLSEQEAQEAGHSLADVFPPSDLKVGQQITLNLATDTGSGDADSSGGRLIGLKLTPSVERDVKLTRGSDGQFIAASVDKPLTERTDRVAGPIDGSLYESAHNAGLPASVIGQIIKSFSYDVDFQRDIHEGDSFEALYERFDADNGDLAKAGNLLYASLTLGGKPLAIYYFEHDGDGAYYTADGQAVRKSLLKTPIDGAKITSGFGMRVHPILGYSAMHKGIDFGAPMGTPIFAAGNGTLEFVGRKNGYGNYMKMRHNGTYETAYAHISRFAKGMHPGVKVKQGEVIAYVGATGRATGPHLHFEIIINGHQVNPASVKTVASDKLTGKTLAAFKAQVASINRQLRDAARRNEIADQSGNATIDCSGPHGCAN